MAPQTGAINFDDSGHVLAKSQKLQNPIIPAKTGMTGFWIIAIRRRVSFHRCDEFLHEHQS
jgi:hypothetical protein